MENFTQEEFNERLSFFIQGIEKLIDNKHQESLKRWGTIPLEKTKMETMEGKKYIRVVRVDQGQGKSVHSFVDKTTGNILKGNWKAPVKNGIRGNVFAKNCLDCVNDIGCKSLRG